ncbi:MAG TPA: bifunctional phosphoribosylaminoimidazolecarboxamide formyltransferase/IMP cyclohydrolase [Longimicrobiales bacterium]|nr:bifunctional phosphoribosylaminoimidazolecarboxamide formyltransferase/IMP cyclohydrolase [Longimicrobiales bacterium]
MPRALLSVSDKQGLADFARGLADRGWELLSTGGTARLLRDAGLEVRDVADVTGHPEMMDGRVKTLHPAIHAGILARRDRADDLRAIEARGYAPIDLIAVNLYPFREAVESGATGAEAMEQVDIGGPTMLRAAAKNHAAVVALVDPADYAAALEALDAGGPDEPTRRAWAAKVFAHTAAYDARIAEHLAPAGRSVARDVAAETVRSVAAADAAPSGTTEAFEAREGDDSPGGVFPATLPITLVKVQDLRYGENPDQPAAFYAETGERGGLPSLEQLHGKDLSFNNLLDVDGALSAASAWSEGDRVACVIVKHTTPCGVALGDDVLSAYQRALACDPVSAFGGIVAVNQRLSADAAGAMAEHFLEVIVAPEFEPEAVEILSRKKNLRLLRIPGSTVSEGLDLKRVRGGVLVQKAMRMRFDESAWRPVCARAPTGEEEADLRFAWRVVASVKSNAIVLAADERTVGIGAGQMSRVDASRIAVMKARDRDVDLTGAVLASDAFFPFRDGVDAAAEAGVTAIVQPGGSVRDEEVIAAADEHDIAMVFTGRRVFRH